MNGYNPVIDEIIENALREDMPYGDITTDSIFTGDEVSSAELMAKEAGVVAGLNVAERVFIKVDEKIQFKALVAEGEYVKKGTVLCKIKGNTASLLKAERTALNFLQRMCGIATKTRKLSDVLKGTDTVIADTRKTTPGLRILEKYSVKTGGGTNHRFSLSDAVMIKDNHITAAGGITKAVERVRENIPHTAKIEVETSAIDEVREAVGAKVDIIMLDNMTSDMTKEAIQIIKKEAVIEVSGNVDEENLLSKAVEGIDIISSGAVTHSVESMDISMKFK